MTTAFVMSGGGAKGSFQMGVLQQLDKLGVKADAVYGTSVGALNAAGYAMSSVDYMTQLWLGIEGPKWYMPWTPSPDLLAFNWSTLALCSEGLYNLNPLAAQLEKHLTSTPVCEAVVCSVSLKTGAIRYTSTKDTAREDFLKATIASAAIPFAMSPVDHEWVDGGVREQLPLAKAVADGHTNIYVISCNPLVQNPPYPYTEPKLFARGISLGWRSINDVMEHQIFLSGFAPFMKSTPGVTFQVYAPSEVYMDTLNFDPTLIRTAIAAGQVATAITVPPF